MEMLMNVAMTATGVPAGEGKVFEGPDRAGDGRFDFLLKSLQPASAQRGEASGAFGSPVVSPPPPGEETTRQEDESLFPPRDESGSEAIDPQWGGVVTLTPPFAVPFVAVPAEESADVPATGIDAGWVKRLPEEPAGVLPTAVENRPTFSGSEAFVAVSERSSSREIRPLGTGVRENPLPGRMEGEDFGTVAGVSVEESAGVPVNPRPRTSLVDSGVSVHQSADVPVAGPDAGGVKRLPEEPAGVLPTAVENRPTFSGSEAFVAVSERSSSREIRPLGTGVRENPLPGRMEGEDFGTVAGVSVEESADVPVAGPDEGAPRSEGKLVRFGGWGDSSSMLDVRPVAPRAEAPSRSGDGMEGDDPSPQAGRPIAVSVSRLTGSSLSEATNRGERTIPADGSAGGGDPGSEPMALGVTPTPGRVRIEAGDEPVVHGELHDDSPEGKVSPAEGRGSVMSGQVTGEPPRTIHVTEEVTLTRDDEGNLDFRLLVSSLSRRVVPPDGAGHSRTVRLLLQPAELGRLDVQVTMENQTVRVEIMAENETVRSFLTERGDLLRESLQRHGLVMDNFDVVTRPPFSSAGDFTGNRRETQILARPRQKPGQRFVESVRTVAAPAAFVGQGSEYGLVDLVL